ncbi:MAG: death-on-curing protein [Proteobacteria bacterium]|nr:death-on-curing protein [Pseudomonadota bacterium]
MTVEQKPKAITSKPLIYQAKDGAIELRLDRKNETIIANVNQIADLFGVQRPAITKHLRNIFADKELNEKVVGSILELTTPHGAVAAKKQVQKVKFYNLDVIIAVGYRVNSKQATNFRIWATKILKSYLLDGYVVNKKHIAKNYEKFLEALDEIKVLSGKKNLKDSDLDPSSAIDLVKGFAETWLSLDAYDKDNLKIDNVTKEQITLSAKDLSEGIANLKSELIKKREATEIFAKERSKDVLEGIIGNVMQSFGGTDLYESLEEKAAHLFYFIVKNHPFTDGNKRSGAFSFVWFLQKFSLIDVKKIDPQTLTALTLLIAESDPKDKDKMVGLVMMLLGNARKKEVS